MIIARKLFVTLRTSTFYGQGVYNVCNDGNHVCYIYADSDEEAIKKFEEMIGNGDI